MVEKNSMLYWYPKIKDLKILQPKTVYLEVNPSEMIGVLDGKPFPALKKLQKKANEIGYPLFLRSDQLSGKHDWKHTCFVERRRNLITHLIHVTEATYGCDVMGKPVNAFFFRKYIPMKNLFTAFWGEMPVNPEIRFFIENGEIKCWHWYWIEEAIQNASIKNWKEILQKEKEALSGSELMWLEADVRKVAERFSNDGFWSVDFCKNKEGRWVLIDMAMGEHSWHPKDCKFNRTMTFDFMTGKWKSPKEQDAV